MKSELQKAADRVRKLQESKPPIAEARIAAHDALAIRQQEVEQAEFNLRAAQREAHYAEAAYKAHEHMLSIELQEVRRLTYSSTVGLSMDMSQNGCQQAVAAGPNPYYNG